MCIFGHEIMGDSLVFAEMDSLRLIAPSVMLCPFQGLSISTLSSTSLSFPSTDEKTNEWIGNTKVEHQSQFEVRNTVPHVEYSFLLVYIF